MAGDKVGAPDGYSSDSGTMQSKAGELEDAAEDAKSDVADNSTPELAKKDFGNEHVDAGETYAEHIKEITAGAKGMCATLSSFAQKIQQARSQYDQADAEQQANVQQMNGSM